MCRKANVTGFHAGGVGAELREVTYARSNDFSYKSKGYR